MLPNQVDHLWSLLRILRLGRLPAANQPADRTEGAFLRDGANGLSARGFKSSNFFRREKSGGRPFMAILLSLAKYTVVQGAEKSGSKAAALQIVSSQYYAGLSRMSFRLVETQGNSGGRQQC